MTYTWGFFFQTGSLVPSPVPRPRKVLNEMQNDVKWFLQDNMFYILYCAKRKWSILKFQIKIDCTLLLLFLSSYIYSECVMDYCW